MKSTTLPLNVNTFVDRSQKSRRFHSRLSLARSRTEAQARYLKGHLLGAVRWCHKGLYHTLALGLVEAVRGGRGTRRSSRMSRILCRMNVEKVQCCSCQPSPHCVAASAQLHESMSSSVVTAATTRSAYPFFLLNSLDLSFSFPCVPRIRQFTPSRHFPASSRIAPPAASLEFPTAALRPSSFR